jgi:hypothetical protein
VEEGPGRRPGIIVKISADASLAPPAPSVAMDGSTVKRFPFESIIFDSTPFAHSSTEKKR